MERGVRVLAVDPTREGYCFAVFEGSSRLLEWGCSRVPARNEKRFVGRIALLFERFDPQLVALEDPQNTRRGPRAKKRITAIGEEAIRRDTYVEVVTREQVQRHFAEFGITKHNIAMAIAGRFPELKSRLPRKRKPWKLEDERMNIFDAASFALVVLARWERKGRSQS